MLKTNYILCAYFSDGRKARVYGGAARAAERRCAHPKLSYWRTWQPSANLTALYETLNCGVDPICSECSSFLHCWLRRKGPGHRERSYREAGGKPLNASHRRKANRSNSSVLIRRSFVIRKYIDRPLVVLTWAACCEFVIVPQVERVNRTKQWAKHT